jgi:uncharacterized protein (TIGR02996 family)
MRQNDPKSAFLKAIDADPLDAAPHLISADWLTENGLDEEAQDQRFLGSIMSDPYNPRLRADYADWMADQGRKAEARQERWLARVFTGRKFRKYDVYTRRTIPAKGYWLRRLPEVFKAHPEILVVVVSEEYLANSGFRRDYGRWAYDRRTRTRRRVGFRSPILFYRKATRAHRSGASGAWVV